MEVDLTLKLNLNKTREMPPSVDIQFRQTGTVIVL